MADVIVILCLVIQFTRQFFYADFLSQFPLFNNLKDTQIIRMAWEIFLYVYFVDYV